MSKATLRPLRCIRNSKDIRKDIRAAAAASVRPSDYRAKRGPKPSSVLKNQNNWRRAGAGVIWTTV